MINVHIDTDTRDKLRKLAEFFPRQVYQAVGRAGSTMRGRLRRVMGSSGGAFGVGMLAPHATLTTLLRGDHIIGGKLANPSAIQMYGKRGTFIVGFVSALEGYASGLQDAEVRTFTPAEIRAFHMRITREFGGGVSRLTHLSGQYYSRPERPIIEPFAAYHQQDFQRWILGAAANAIDSAMHKRGFSAMDMA